MNLLVVDRRRTPWLTPWGVLGTLFVLASLLLLMLIAKVGWETSSTFNAAGLLGVLGSPGDLAAGGRSSWVASQAIIGIPVLLIALLAAFGIASLALPGTMTNYWMKYLTLPANAGKKRVAIKELRSAKDPGALLVLIDIAMDPAEDEQVRRAAAEAVTDMRQDWINGPGLESAIASDDPRGIVEVLTTAFERRGKFRAQSAFTIGRQHMRLGRYADAREWLEKARRRDAKLMLFGDRVDRLIQDCNDRLLAEGDAMYAAGEYHGAREHYALLSQGLDDREKRRFAVFLRSACVYCKLKDYRDADEAVLLALRFDQETDKSLALIDLLQRLPGHNAKTANAKEAPMALTRKIDRCVASLMDGLSAKRNPGPTEITGTQGIVSH